MIEKQKNRKELSSKIDTYSKNKPLPHPPPSEALNEMQNALCQEITELLEPKTTGMKETPSQVDFKGNIPSGKADSPSSAFEAQRSFGMENAPDLGTLLLLLGPEMTDMVETQSRTLELIQQTLKRARPEEWELREMGVNCGMPGSDSYFVNLAAAPDTPTNLTAKAYLEHYEYEMWVCAHLTGLIRERCRGKNQSEVEVLEALWELNGSRWSQVHQAFWRVWSFCRIFGCMKGRENDLLSQEQWLSGCLDKKASFGATYKSLDMHSEVLSLPPDSFACGNGSGLSVIEIKDMMAVWSLLEDLLRAHLQSPPTEWKWQPEHQGKDKEFIYTFIMQRYSRTIPL